MKRALLVIDVQNEYFTGMLPITHPVGHLGKILEVMDASAGRVPTVVIQHRMLEEDKPFFQKGKPGWELHPEVEGRPRDLRIEKTLPGSFTGTGTRELAAGAGHRYRDHCRLHDAHVLRHDRATGRSPGLRRRVPERRDRHAAAHQLSRLRHGRGIAPVHSLCPANDAQRGPSLLGLDRPNPSQHHESLRLPLDASIEEPEILPLVGWRPTRIRPDPIANGEAPADTTVALPRIACYEIRKMV